MTQVTRQRVQTRKAASARQSTVAAPNQGDSDSETEQTIDDSLEPTTASSSNSSSSSALADQREQEDQIDTEYERKEHPVQPFFLPQSIFRQVLLFPQQFVFAIAGIFGLAHFSRQIVKVVPKRPGSITLLKGHGHGASSASGSKTGGAHNGVTQNEDAEPTVKVDQWIDENVKCLRGSFKPSWWLPNGHLQTIYSVLGNFNNVDQVVYDRTYLRTRDDGTIALDFLPKHHATLDPSTPTIVLCHGLTGGSHESYVRNVVAWAVKPVEEGGIGARAVVVNFRGCAGAPVTSSQLYSAGTTIDLSLALHYLRYTLPKSSLHGIGFSLGASVLSRYLGESGPTSLLSSGIVLGCPWDLTAMSDKLENDFITRHIYSSAMAQNLLRMFFSHYDKDPTIFDSDESPIRPHIAALRKMKKNKRGVTLKTVDNVMVSKVGGPVKEGMWPFINADAYYEWACPKDWMWNVSRPLLSINAFDDPIVDGSALPISEFESSSYVYEAITGGGGHLGWFNGPIPIPFWSASSKRSKSRWILEPIKEWFGACFRDLRVEGCKEVEVDEFPADHDFQALGETRPLGNAAKSTNGLEEEGWKVVRTHSHRIQGLDEGERLRWKVMSKEQVGGAGESGVMQGL